MPPRPPTPRPRVRATDAAVDYGRQVRPLLARRCFACHGPGDAESSLALHTEQTALAATDYGEPAIVPGDAAASRLIERVGSTDEYERMPPEGEPLTPEEVDLLRRWIDQGAKFEQHWAYQAPADPVPPSPAETPVGDAWAAGPIDAFVLDRLTEADLTPNPPADRRTLIRRVTLDLTGLPPTPEQVAAFLADERPDAYERLVDGILASPTYGERWARHWLDVVRYAETNSYERDGAKPNAWRYRDYVIAAFNDDKPYDEFVTEQLAGDLLAGRDAETMTATGYYRLGVWDDEPADPLQARYDELDGIVRTTTEGFLGLTVGCARCHDHKIDPIMQADYYRMLAFFADVTPYAMRHDQTTFSQHEITPLSVRDDYTHLDAVIGEYDDQIEAIERRGRDALEGEGYQPEVRRRRDHAFESRLPLVLSADERDDWLRLRAGPGCGRPGAGPASRPRIYDGPGDARKEPPPNAHPLSRQPRLADRRSAAGLSGPLRHARPDPAAGPADNREPRW